MLRYERDYILRMIAAAAAVAARLRERLIGGTAPDAIVREARQAQGELLGKEATLLRALDPASAAHAIGDSDRLGVWIALLRVEAEAQRMTGDERAAELILARAVALEELARRQR